MRRSCSSCPFGHHMSVYLHLPGYIGSESLIDIRGGAARAHRRNQRPRAPRCVIQSRRLIRVHPSYLLASERPRCRRTYRRYGRRTDHTEPPVSLLQHLYPPTFVLHHPSTDPRPCRHLCLASYTPGYAHALDPLYTACHA